MDQQPEEQTKTETAQPSANSIDGTRWYIVHTYSGHEDKVAKNLKQRVESMGFGNKIFDIILNCKFFIHS